MLEREVELDAREKSVCWRDAQMKLMSHTLYVAVVSLPDLLQCVYCNPYRGVALGLGLRLQTSHVDRKLEDNRNIRILNISPVYV